MQQRWSLLQLLLSPAEEHRWICCCQCWQQCSSRHSSRHNPSSSLNSPSSSSSGQQAMIAGATASSHSSNPGQHSHSLTSKTLPACIRTALQLLLLLLLLRGARQPRSVLSNRALRPCCQPPALPQQLPQRPRGMHMTPRVYRAPGFSTLCGRWKLSSATSSCSRRGCLAASAATAASAGSAALLR